MGGAGLAGAALLGVAGCGGGSEGSSSGATQLTFTFGPDESGGLRALVDQFNQENSGEIEVKWRETAAASDEYFDQMKSELQSGQASVDVIGGDVIWPAQFAAQGLVLDLSERFTDGMKSKHLDGPLQATEFEGKTFAVPWFTDAGMFYYRKDLLKKSGLDEPPKTWDAMKDMIERVRKDSDIRYGYVFQGASDEGGVVDALEHVWNAGGDVLKGDKVVLDSPEAAEGLAVRRSLISDGFAPQASGDYSTQESQSVFTNGDAIFMRNWPFVYGLLASSETSNVRPEQVGIAPIPVSDTGTQSSSGLGGWNFLVNATSEDKLDQAWAFMEFMSSPESQKRLALKSTRLPTLKDLYEDEEILDKVPVASLGREALGNSRPRPVSPYYSDMSLEMSDQFNASVKGDASPQETVKSLDAALREIVKQG